MSTFKQEKTLEERKAETEKIRKKYDDRYPIIVERSPKTDLPEIEKKKYLVPGDITIAQFMLTAIRKNLKLTAEKALFLFVKDNIIPQTASQIKEVYDEHKDEDGFLYITYAGENTFGSPNIHYCPKCGFSEWDCRC